MKVCRLTADVPSVISEVLVSVPECEAMSACSLSAPGLFSENNMESDHVLMFYCADFSEPVYCLRVPL